jgi:hypothetical protein
VCVCATVFDIEWTKKRKKINFHGSLSTLFTVNGADVLSSERGLCTSHIKFNVRVRVFFAVCEDEPRPFREPQSRKSISLFIRVECTTQ